MNTLDWLQSPGLTLKDAEPRTILEEMSQLIGMNGGMQWKGFGVMTTGGPYGRLGLAMEEAIRLVYLSGVLDGLTKAEDGANTKAVTEAIKAEIRKAGENKKPSIVGVDGRSLNEDR